jgi:hypothetical protein
MAKYIYNTFTNYSAMFESQGSLDIRVESLLVAVQQNNEENTLQRGC